MTAFYKQSWFAPVASAATNFLFPSLGGSIGSAVNGVLGGAMSEGVANALGSAIVGGGIGGLSSGGQGALTGALTGGLTRGLMDYTGYNQGLSGLINNGSFSLPNGTPNAVAAAGGARDSNIATTNGVTGGNAGAAAAATGKTASSGMGALTNPAMIAGLALAGSMGSSLMGQKQSQSGAPPTTTTDPNMTRGLSQVAFNRTYRAPEGDLTRYGMTGGQHRFYEDNRLPATVAAAEGGLMRSERLQAEQAKRSFDAEMRPMSIVDWMKQPQAVRDAYDRSLIKKDEARARYRETGGYPGYANGGPVMAQRPMGALGAMGPAQMPQRPVGFAEGGEARMPRRVNTPTPDSAYGGKRAFWNERYRPDNYVDVGLGHVPSHPLVYGGTADLAQTVSPVQGVARQRNMGALEILSEAMRGDPDARFKVRGNARDYPRFDAEYARGGVSGAGTGRSDDIPAVLSDGEYVVDATTVALLGDGSSKAGAQKLDEMREAIRRRHGAALAKGKMGPDAKPALSYLGGGR